MCKQIAAALMLGSAALVVWMIYLFIILSLEVAGHG